MFEITETEKEKLLETISKKILKSVEVSKYKQNGPPFFKAIELLLDAYNKMNFYGVMEIKVAGPNVKEVAQRRTFKPDTMYSECGDSLVRYSVKKKP